MCRIDLIKCRILLNFVSASTLIISINKKIIYETKFLFNRQNNRYLPYN